MNTEFTKLNRQDATTARATGHASVNNIIEGLANTTGELVATISKQHTKQVETLMKFTNAALDKLTAAILANKPDRQQEQRQRAMAPRQQRRQQKRQRGRKR
jgi:hypothetical protein